MKKQKLLLIGWDAADWKAIHPLMDSGLMPNLEKLINQGVMGNLNTLDPPLSPMLWTSIATGKRPFKHGIHGFTEPRPDGKGIRPVLNTSRKCKALWNILMQSGYKSHVVGWWPSHPAEPINGTMISNFFQKAVFPQEGEILKEWPVTPGTVHPPEKQKLFAQMRVHPNELTGAHLQPFVPNGHLLDQTDKATQQRLSSLRKTIADCSSIHAAATYILQFEEWDFVGVYYDAIDHFGHGFMKFHPPKRDHIPQKLFDAWHNVITAGYQYHDLMLGRLMQLAGEETTIMLISDHGFHPDHLRPEGIPKEPAGPAFEHSPYGIFVMKGPGINKDNLVYGASLLDVVPTILATLGLPVADDMDGKVLENVFQEKPTVSRIETWEAVPGECGMHPTDMRHDPYMDKEALDQLVELGYIDKPDENVEKAVRNTVNENNFWLARSYMDAGIYADALPLLQDLYENQPDQIRYGFRLVRCLQMLGQLDPAEAVLNQMRIHIPEKTAQISMLEGNLLMLKDEPEKALEQFIQAEVTSPNNPHIFMHIGQAYLKMNKWLDAQRNFQKALDIDPQSHFALYGKGLSFLRMGSFEEAAAHLVEAIGLTYNFPAAHYHLGEALTALDDHEAAAHAYQACIKLNEKALVANERLVTAYQGPLGQPEKASAFATDWLAQTEKEIIVVSGLPRSGTSMMMQMLEKGGLPPFTDQERQPDENNPKGYYEHEAVKGLSTDKKFLQEIDGKAVKIIAQLLLQLPLRYRYKVIFMQRDLDEVVRSQTKMLERLAQGNQQKQRQTQALRQAFDQTMKRVHHWQQMPNVEILYVDYAEAIENPAGTARQVNDFLGGGLEVAKMAGTVDSSLYRERSAQLPEAV